MSKEAKSDVKEWLKTNAPKIPYGSSTAVVADGDIIFLFTPDHDGYQGAMKVYNKDGTLLDKQYVHNSLHSGVASGKAKKSIDKNYIKPWIFEVSGGRRPINNVERLPPNWKPSYVQPASNPVDGGPLESNREELKKVNEDFSLEVGNEREQNANIEKVYHYLLALKKTKGLDPQEVLRDWLENPELIPKSLGMSSIDHLVFNKVSNALEESLDPREIIQRGQKGRQDALSSLEEQREAQTERDRQKLAALVDPKTGIPALRAIYDSLTPEQKEHLSFRDLLEMKRAHDNAAFGENRKEAGDSWSEGFRKHFPTVLNMNLEPPTREMAEKAFKERYPHFTPKSAQYYNDQSHQLANAGYGYGSSSYDVIEGEKSQAATEERERMIDGIYRGLIDEHKLKGDTIGYVGKFDDNAAKAYGAPIELEKQTFDPLMAQNAQVDQLNNQYDKDLAEGEMQDATQTSKEDLLLKQILEQDNFQEQQQMDQLHNEVLKYVDLFHKLQQGTIKNDAELKVLGQQMWAERQKVAAMFEQMKMYKEADALREAQNDQSRWIGIFTTAATLIGGLANSHFDRKARKEESTANHSLYQQLAGGGRSPYIGSSSGDGGLSPFIRPTTNAPGAVIGGRFSY